MEQPAGHHSVRFSSDFTVKYEHTCMKTCFLAGEEVLGSKNVLVKRSFVFYTFH